jgi:hypothetical protein
VEEYRKLLGQVDAWYRSVQERHPADVPCRKGCRDCCLGLFDVTLADRELLRLGMDAADPATRRDIEARALAILGELRKTHPALGPDLGGFAEGEIDALCDLLGPVECPVLGPEGECRLYAYRPLTCRLSGVPVVDLSGKEIFPEGCSRCTLKAKDAPRLDCEALLRREQKILRKRYSREAPTTLLIPQAVGPAGG